MAWFTRVGAGDWRSSDDLTVEELTAVEAAAKIGWGYINPWTSMPAAAAILATWLVRDGKTDDEAKAEVAKLTGKTLKHTFKWVADDDLPDSWEDGLPVVDPKDQDTSTASS